MEEKSSLHERQWNEASAIQAIYPNEYEEVKPAWKVAGHPPHFVLHLQSESGFALDLEFQLGARYPQDVPLITLTRKRGLLAAQVNDLYASLGELAKGCVGKEMVFDLIEHAKEALNAFGQKKVSFHDQMLQDRKQRAMQVESELPNRKQEAMAMENRIKQELERKQQLLIVEESSGDSSENPNCISFDPELVFYEPGLDYAKYIDRVTIKRELDTIEYNNNIKCQLFEVTFENCNLWLKKFDLEPFSKSDSDKFDRRVEGFLKRVNDVGLLTHNPYIVRVIGAQSIDRSLLVICEQTKSKPLMQSSIPTKMADLKIIFKQLAVGLNHIHQSNYIHKDLRLTTLFFDPKSMVMQIGDIHFHHELNVLLHSEDFPVPNSWLPTELKEKSTATRKTDVWFLGIVYIQLLYGFTITAKYPNWNSLKAAVNPISQLAHLLDGIMQSSANYRLTTADIVKHEFFDDTVGSVALGDITTIGGRNTGASGRNAINSRFETDFEQLEVLGKGGFGEVVKARNRVDNRFYAIKKINLDPENVDYNRKILREVMTLSRLQHDRVVRYYQAWIEGSTSQQQSGPPPENALDVLSDLSDSDASDFIDFVNTSHDWLGDSLLDNPVREDPSIELSLMKLNRTGFSDSEESFQTSSSNLANDEPSVVYQTLLIQMEYCPKRTLRDLIDEGLEPGEIWRLFRQIVEGLAYIHSQGMIHRDLKPSNIFMDQQGNVKIGDFGLATSSTTSYSGSGKKSKQHQNDQSLNESLTAGIGTPFYTSPEQEQPKARYNNKVDLFSLGIIFLEMWCRFDTAMERVDCLKAARSEQIVLPSMFESEELLNQKTLLLNLLSHDPKKRIPSADLLTSELLPVRIENEQINSVLKSVTNPVNPSFSNLIDLLFKNSPDSLKDFAYDFSSNNVFEMDVLLKMAHAKEKMVQVFRSHGAIDTTIPLFQLSTIDAPDAVKLIDATGQRLDVPFDLTRPFARFVARNSITDFRRFAFERIFRRSVLPGGQPRQPIECDFDVIFSQGAGLVEEAEVIKVAIDAISAACGCGQPQLTLIIGNVQFAKLLAQSLAIEENFFLECLQGVQHFGSQKRTSALMAKFPSLPIEKIQKLSQGDAKNRSQILLEMLGKYGRLAQPAIAHLNALIETLRGPFELKQCAIVIDPLFVHNPAVYGSGLCFQLLLLSQTTKRKKAIEVLAAGGRYDQLVGHYKYPSAYGTFTGAVGVSFSINKLAGLIADDIAAISAYLWPSTDDAHLDDMLSIACQLWSAGLSVKVVHRAEYDKLEPLTTQARQQGIKHIVVVNSNRRALKVRDVDKLIDTDIARSDIVSFLQTDPQSSSLVQQLAPSPLPTEYNVVLLGSLGGRLHGTQRSVLTEKAIRAVSSLHLSPPTLTVVIHDLGRDLIRKVFDCVDDRKIMDAFGAGKRDSVEKVKGCRDKARDQLEPIVCFYSYKDNVVDVLVTR